jgi:hypothetical protein
MPSPKSPITLLAEALNATPMLKGFAKVLAGKDELAKGRAPPSIVIYPWKAGYRDAQDNISSFVDVDLQLAARLWGRNDDEAWDLRARFIAALWNQAFGDVNNADDSVAGFYFTMIDETWDIVPDTAVQGQELEVLFVIRASASEKSLSIGVVVSESMTKTSKLAVAMLAGDTVANVDATAGGYASTGVLHIDAEMMSYSGLTPTSFTGLVRGINGTTAAAHPLGAAVSVTPT